MLKAWGAVHVHKCDDISGAEEHWGHNEGCAYKSGACSRRWDRVGARRKTISTEK